MLIIFHAKVINREQMQNKLVYFSFAECIFCQQCQQCQQCQFWFFVCKHSLHHCRPSTLDFYKKRETIKGKEIFNIIYYIYTREKTWCWQSWQSWQIIIQMLKCGSTLLPFCAIFSVFRWFLKKVYFTLVTHYVSTSYKPIFASIFFSHTLTFSSITLTSCGMASTASSMAGFCTLQAGNCWSVKLWHLLAAIVLYSYLCIVIRKEWHERSLKLWFLAKAKVNSFRVSMSC